MIYAIILIKTDQGFPDLIKDVSYDVYLKYPQCELSLGGGGGGHFSPGSF